MSTTTIEAPVAAPEITAAAPLTDAEGDALLTASASLERTPRVKGGTSTSVNRAWSRGGNVD